MLSLLRLGIVTCVLFAASAGLAADTELLKHDDNSQEEKRSMTGAGHAVRFECPDGDRWYVTGINIRGSRYGAAQPPNENFKIVIASDDLSQRVEIEKPYSIFERGNERWVRIDFDPVEVNSAFQAAVFFNPTRTKGVYVAIDTDASPAHSTILSASDPSQPGRDMEGDWMIRAYLTKQAEVGARTLMGEEARTEKRLENEAVRDKEVLGDARSLSLAHDAGPTEDKMNIQGALYTVAFDTPQNVEGYVWQVQVYASQFGGQHDSEAVSGDVYVLNENRQILSRTTFPYSVATQERQWISIPTLPTKVKGKFYVSVDTHGTKYKGLYMGYQDEAGQQLATTDQRKDDKIAPGDWSDKFANMQWLVRVKIADRPVSY